MNADRRRLRRCWPWLVVCAAACHATPRDAYRAGEQALARGELTAALAAFDAVLVTDLRYPEARLGAAAIERRLRRQLELLLQGIRCRNEWRDDAAIDAFRGALDAWPDHLETLQLLTATQRRRAAIESLRALAGAATTGGTPSAELPSSAAEPRDPAPQSERLAAPGQPAEAVDLPKAHRPPSGHAPAVPTSGAPYSLTPPDTIGTELARIEAQMLSGQIEPVLTDLVALQQRVPDDGRVTGRLARLLQQRGLLRYGQGQVPAAVADLQRATELDPALQSARLLFELAARDLAAPAPGARSEH